MSAKASAARLSSMPTGSRRMTNAGARRRRVRRRTPIPFLKRFTVFNTAQCEGLPDEMMAMAPPVETDLVLPQAEALIRATGVDFRISGERAFYNPQARFRASAAPTSLFRTDQLAPDRAARNRSRQRPFLASQPRSDRVLRVEEIRVRRADRGNFCRVLMRLAPHHAHGAPRRLYRFVARRTARGQPRHRAGRQRRVEGGGLHPGVPVRKLPRQTRQSQATTKGRQPDGRSPPCRVSAETQSSDIRAPAFPAFRVCGSSKSKRAAPVS